MLLVDIFLKALLRSFDSLKLANFTRRSALIYGDQLIGFYGSVHWVTSRRDGLRLILSDLQLAKKQTHMPAVDCPHLI